VGRLNNRRHKASKKYQWPHLLYFFLGLLDQWIAQRRSSFLLHPSLLSPLPPSPAPPSLDENVSAFFLSLCDAKALHCLGFAFCFYCLWLRFSSYLSSWDHPSASSNHRISFGDAARGQPLLKSQIYVKWASLDSQEGSTGTPRRTGTCGKASTDKSWELPGRNETNSMNQSNLRLAWPSIGEVLCCRCLCQPVCHSDRIRSHSRLCLDRGRTLPVTQNPAESKPRCTGFSLRRCFEKASITLNQTSSVPTQQPLHSTYKIIIVIDALSG